MLKKLLLASTAVSGFAVCGASLAADLHRPIYKAPPPIAAPFSWTGCHIGGQFGGGWGGRDWSDFGGSLFSELFGGKVIPVLEFVTGSASGTFSGTVSDTASNTSTVSGTATVTVHAVTSASFFPDNQTFTNSHAIQITQTQTVTVGSVSGTFSFTATVSGSTSETFTTTVTGTTRTNRINSFNDETAGFLAGGQVGCDLQFAGRWVIGAEGEGEWAHITGSSSMFFTNAGSDNIIIDGLPIGAPLGGVTSKSRTNWLASVTGRLGYTPWDRLLLYVKGGGAWAGNKYTLNGAACSEITAPPPVCTTTPFYFGGNETRFGWTAGLGIEYAFYNNWSAKLEYDFYDFGTKNVTFTDALGNFGPGSAAIRQRLNVVKVGVNYNFFWGQPP